MNTIDRIRAEIERRIEAIAKSPSDNGIMDSINGAKGHELMKLLSFLDTLEEPEQPTRGYDEAYLNEKIAKASKSWKGVDVDKYMDEVRGREPVSEDLDKKTFDDYLKANPAERRKMKMTEILGEERLAKTKEQMDLEEAAEKYRFFDFGTPDEIAQTAFKAGAEWQKQKSAENGKELLYVCDKSYKIGYRDGKRDAEQKQEGGKK